MRKIISFTVLLLFAIKLGLTEKSHINKLNFRDCTPASSTKIIKASIDNCYDTHGCKMPNCCGIIGGKLSNISFTYIATIPMETGSNHGILNGLSIDALQVPIPETQVPNLIAGYEADACLYTVCPQRPGETYTWSGIFTVPTAALSTTLLIGDFVVSVTSNVKDDPTVFCAKFYAKFVNSNLIPSVTTIVKNPVLGVKLNKLLPGA